jgi:DNA polymerase-3 subunit epsilon
MDFVAIDVETANPDMASIYQVGIAGFRDGHIVSEWKSLVNPEVGSA